MSEPTSQQADLRLVNLLSRGYTMAEARKILKLDQPKAEPVAPSKPADSAPPSAPKAEPDADESLL